MNRSGVVLRVDTKLANLIEDMRKANNKKSTREASEDLYMITKEISHRLGVDLLKQSVVREKKVRLKFDKQVLVLR